MLAITCRSRDVSRILSRGFPFLSELLAEVWDREYAENMRAVAAALAVLPGASTRGVVRSASSFRAIGLDHGKALALRSSR